MTFTESEWTADEVALLLAAREVERERGPHGFPMSEATDPANQFVFVGSRAPVVDYAEKARLDAEDAYMREHDSDKNHPLNRNGLIFRVKKRTTAG